MGIHHRPGHPQRNENAPHSEGRGVRGQSHVPREYRGAKAVCPDHKEDAKSSGALRGSRWELKQTMARAGTIYDYHHNFAGCLLRLVVWVRSGCWMMLMLWTVCLRRMIITTSLTSCSGRGSSSCSRRRGCCCMSRKRMKWLVRLILLLLLLGLLSLLLLLLL